MQKGSQKPLECQMNDVESPYIIQQYTSKDVRPNIFE